LLEHQAPRIVHAAQAGYREEVAMASMKVLTAAIGCAILFGGVGMVLLDGIERSVGKSSTVVIMGLACVGLLLGAVVGAAQAVVDAIRQPK
jgi:hypothetical protein